MIRVLFVTHTALMGGANRSLMQLMLELRDRHDVEPVVLMPKIPKYMKQWNMQAACQKQNIACYSLAFHWFRDTRRLIFYLRCLTNLINYPLAYFKMRRERFDLIHSNGSVISLGAFLSRVKHVPHVWHLREFGLLDFGLVSLLGSWYEKWVFRHGGDVFIAISEAVKNCYADKVPHDRLRMIYNGILPPKEAAAKKSTAGTVQFCMVGMLSSPKNQLEALQAVNVLVNTWGLTQLHLTLIGFEEPVYTGLLREFVAVNGLESYVSFLGEHDDVGALLDQMHVGLMLSKNEAFGRVTVEYMMHGMAVIASDTGANPEIIDNGVTGYLYPLGDSSLLAEHMKAFVDNRETLCLFADNGRKKALAEFTSYRNTEQVYGVYRQLLTAK